MSDNANPLWDLCLQVEAWQGEYLSDNMLRYSLNQAKFLGCWRAFKFWRYKPQIQLGTANC